ncbi:hypothetical protein HZI73_18965 [Vallitalea pronyensis]|uniref:Uncharacterized protein n=1 Tax=Vallitalea pronyensis TaxID=1348613 RepID=A0A8J8MM22_9FIRM|nr:hypothetical protein [Vallitalea pronyensis]QUI24245.1 hypothetical protein HZI73_18965 [Vallitalea pronyensis]
MKKETRYTYIMLSDTGSILTRLIKKYTKIPYNHVSVALDEELNEMYSFGRKFPRNPLIAGFVREYVDRGTFANFKDTTCLVLKIKITTEQRKQLIQNIEYFKQRKRRFYYNIFCLFTMPFNIPLKVPYGYVCTHFVAHVHERSGVKLFNKKSYLVSTIDFYQLDNVDIIYEGKLSDFQKYRHLDDELVCS